MQEPDRDPNGVDPASAPLAGHAALVTGGGSGIGLACARALVGDGCSVTITGRTEERLRSGAEVLSSAAVAGAEVRWVVADAADEEATVAAVELAKEPTGQLDHAVANAGRGGLGPIITTPLEEWAGILSTNLTGTFLVLKHAGADIARAHADDPPERPGGSIVAISSIAAVATHPFMGPYCVSKAGIDMLVRVTADELGRAGVRVNSVRPGIVDTDLVSMVIDDEQVMGSYLENMPVPRAGRPGDVARLVRFLLGPESAWITGTSVSVDGGHHLRRGPDYEPAARAFFGDDAVDGRLPPGTP